MWKTDDGQGAEPRTDMAGELARIPFEELVSLRLRPVVDLLDEGGENRCIYREVMNQVERALIRLALERTDGNQQRAARLLGISRNTLRTKRNGHDNGGTTE